MTDPFGGRASAERGGLRAIFFAALAYLVLAGAHAWLVPLFEGPDEPGNLLYVRYVAEEGRLARPTTEVSPELELLDRGIVPPLWFAVTAPLFRALGASAWNETTALNPRFLRRSGASSVDEALAEPTAHLHFLHGRDEREPLSGAGFDVRVLRLSTALWGALAVLAVGIAAKRALGSASLGAWSAALAAFTPQLQHLGGTITNDLALAALGGFALCSGARWCDPREGERSVAGAALLAGVFAGAAALTKLNGLVLAPACLLAALLAWRNGARFVGPAALCALGWLLIAGPYYVWAWTESGHPLWGWHYQKISPYHNPIGQPEGVAGLAGWYLFARTLFLTWLADFGWTAVWFPGWVYAAFAALLGAGAVALVPRLARARWNDGRRVDVPLVFLTLSALGMLAAEVFFNLRFPQPHGRHLYAFLPALVVPLAAGLARLGLLRFAVVAHLALSLAAFPSLVSKLRPEGWNDDPRWSATDALRRADPGLVDPDRADLAWLSPEPGSVLPSEEAPVLRWETRDGAAHGPGGSGDVVAYDVILAVDNPLFEHRPWDPDRIVFRTLWAGLDLRGELRLPESFWGAIEPGEMLSVQVLELGSDGLVSARSARADFVKRGP